VPAKEHLSTADGGDLESPFVDEELFVGAPEEESAPEAALTMESPFQDAFDEGEGQMPSPEMDERESFGEEGAVEERFEHDVPALGTVAADHSLRAIADGLHGQLPADILEAILAKGESDANDLTNRAFWQKHAGLSGQQLDPKDPKQKALRQEWGTILSRQVKPVIWLRGLIDEIDKHRGSIPREFLLGWMAIESDGRVSTVSPLGERGYFQIMWQGGEAKTQLGLTESEFRRLTTDREFSIEKGVQLAEVFRQHFLRKFPQVPDGSDLLWRLTKGRHALPSTLDRILDKRVKAGTPITWQAVSKGLPARISGNIDRTLDVAGKLKPLADLVPAPAAATPELYAESESESWFPGSESAEGTLEADEHDTGEFAEIDREDGHEEKIWDGEESADDRDAELLSEEIAELLPPRVFLSGGERELLVDETPPLPKGVHAFEHWVTPMKRDAATSSWIPDGAERMLEPLDPGFLDASGELKTGALHDSLKQLLAGNPAFRPGAGGTLRVALVDLTGSKLLHPEVAGSGSTVAVDGASCPKVAALYAAFQLRNDLKHVAAAEKIKTTAELVRIMTDRWKGIAGAPRLDLFLYRLTNPPDLEFTAEVDGAVDNIIDQKKANFAARILIDAVGFPYIASLMWQSGLRHPTRGGLWLTTNYAGGASWRSPSKPPPAPVFGHNATALSLATFFTLLAQGRLARSGLPRTIKTALSTASWFTGMLPSATIASKVGLLLKCLRFGPKMKDGKPIIVNGRPVQECKDSIATHVHEAALIENEGFRYAVAIMTTGIPTGVSLLQRLIGELDGLIRRNNP
jgi:hypothetical protein